MFKKYFKKLLKEVLEENMQTPNQVISPQNFGVDQLWQKVYDLEEQLRALARSQGKFIVKYGTEDIKKSEQVVQN